MSDRGRLSLLTITNVLLSYSGSVFVDTVTILSESFTLQGSNLTIRDSAEFSGNITILADVVNDGDVVFHSEAVPTVGCKLTMNSWLVK